MLKCSEQLQETCMKQRQLGKLKYVKNYFYLNKHSVNQISFFFLFFTNNIISTGWLQSVGSLLE